MEREREDAERRERDGAGARGFGGGKCRFLVGKTCNSEGGERFQATIGVAEAGLQEFGE